MNDHETADFIDSMAKVYKTLFQECRLQRVVMHDIITNHILKTYTQSAVFRSLKSKRRFNRGHKSVVFLLRDMFEMGIHIQCQQV